MNFWYGMERMIRDFCQPELSAHTCTCMHVRTHLVRCLMVSPGHACMPHITYVDSAVYSLQLFWDIKGLLSLIVSTLTKLDISFAIHALGTAYEDCMAVIVCENCRHVRHMRHICGLIGDC